MRTFSGRYHGTEGPLKVDDLRYHHPLSEAFIRATQEIGETQNRPIQYNYDFNGESQEGVGIHQVTQVKASAPAARVVICARPSAAQSRGEDRGAHRSRDD